MKTRMTQLRTGKIPYETVYGQYMENARSKRVAVPERTRWPAETEEPEFLNMLGIRTVTYCPNSSFYPGVRNRISFNENQ